MTEITGREHRLHRIVQLLREFADDAQFERYRSDLHEVADLTEMKIIEDAVASFKKETE